MSDITETIQETIEQSGESKLNARIALLVAITATVMALCNLKDGNVVQAMSQAQARGLNAWSYFQSKSTKQAIAEEALDGLKAANNSANAEVIRKYEEKIARYEKEKAEIKAKAEGFEQEYDAINIFDDQFDMTEAFLTIALTLFGITALTQNKRLYYFACVVSTTGFILGVAAFLRIPLHSDFISKILG